MSVTEEIPPKFGDRLTALQRDIICVLSGYNGGVSGQEVKQELEDYYGKKIHKGRLYPNLESLYEYGLVKSRAFDGRENRYELTEAGRRAYATHQSWRSSWVDTGGDE